LAADGHGRQAAVRVGQAVLLDSIPRRLIGKQPGANQDDEAAAKGLVACDRDLVGHCSRL
jgi:hypothetical protein